MLKVNRSDCYELTHPQKRIWYVEKVNLNTPLHNLGGCLNIYGKVDFAIMQKTINMVIERNEGMRIQLVEIDGQPMQYICAFVESAIDFFDFSLYGKPKEEFELWVSRTSKNCFRLYNEKLFYFAMYSIGDDQSGVLLKVHHIISDGWSASLIQKQICEIYTQLINCQEPQELQENRGFSYKDYIREEREYLKSEKFIKNKCYWNEKFNNLSEEFLYNSSNSVQGKRSSIDINKDLSESIRAFVSRERCSLNTFFSVVLMIYLYKTMNMKDLVIGIPTYNRTNKRQKSIVGMFTGTMPLRFELFPDLDVSSIINSVNKEIKHCLANQKYPYNLLIGDLGISRSGYDSLFKMWVNYYNTQFIEKINGIEASVEEFYNGSQSYSMQLTVMEWKADEISLNFDYKVKEYSITEIRAMQQAIIYIAEQISTNKELKITGIKLLRAEECRQKIYGMNMTSIDYPQKTVCELFENQVIACPSKIALEYQDQVLTYQELNEKSNQLAHYLHMKNVGKGSTVAIMETHSFELVLSILAVLKVGAAYVPIDPDNPIARVNYMIDDSNSFLLLTNFNTDDALKYSVEVIDIRSIDIGLYNKKQFISSSGMNELAYIIYTSGSTGKPKGVMIKHQGLTNYLLWAAKTYFNTVYEAMPLYSSIAFDLTVTSIFAPLISGNRIVVYPNDGEEFVLQKIIREDRVTVVKLTPAHLTLLKGLSYEKTNLKVFIVGGDNLTTSLTYDIKCGFDGIEIFNEYGPTETVVGCMIHKYDEKEDKGFSVPIGLPIDNVQVYILDQNHDVVPNGIEGEIYIAGDGVSLGYINRLEQTRERFLENPFIVGKPMYKTGDLARYLESGIIEYIGRIDKQVKIRGHRVELKEIEKQLIDIEVVDDAIVLLADDSLGNRVLNAYIVGNNKISEKELKTRLSQYLPQYMMPSNFIFMDFFPLTINGKIDITLLPKPRISENEFVSFATRTEEVLVDVIKEVLVIENVSMNDNFYHLGGDSIKAIQISSTLNNAGLSIKVKDILSYDTIREIATHLDETHNKSIISQSLVSGSFGRTPIVEWFFCQKFASEGHYCQSVLLQTDVQLDNGHIVNAIVKLIEHHDSLRLNYNHHDKILYYNNSHLDDASPVDFHDLTTLNKKDQDAAICELGGGLKSSIDINNGRLFKACVFDLGERGQMVLLIAHHLIVDGISWRILIEDFSDLLEQQKSDQMPHLPPKTNSLKDWFEHFIDYYKRDFELKQEYWSGVVSTSFIFPYDYDLGLDTMDQSSSLFARVDKHITLKLRTVVHETYGIELNDVLIIAVTLALNEITGSENITIELENHGRSDLIENIDVSRTIGWFTSLYPACFKVAGQDLDESIKSLKEQIRRILNKGFDFGILKYIRKDLDENSNRYIRLNYLGDFDGTFLGNLFRFSNMSCGADISGDNFLTALLDINAMVLNEELEIRITYSKNKFKEDTVRCFLRLFVEKLNAILEQSGKETDRRLTPSDFSTANISQKDLDSLF